MCDEVVTLWKLAALNPCISPAERETLKQRLIQYHKTVIEKVKLNVFSVECFKTNDNFFRFSRIRAVEAVRPAQSQEN